MSALKEAMLQVNGRKEALAGKAADDEHSESFFVERESLALLFGGYDLDAIELHRVAGWFAMHVVASQLPTTPVPSMVSGSWLDGVLTGLLLADKLREDDGE